MTTDTKPMTARERAIRSTTGLWLSDDIGTVKTVPADAERIVEELDSAGLAIVDRELFEALVGAVRGLEWSQHWTTVYPDHWWPPSDVAQDAHYRAIALLDERGE